MKWSFEASLGAHTLFARDEGFGSNPALSNSNGGGGTGPFGTITTQSGSMILLWTMGWLSNAATPNADSYGNTYTAALSGPNVYSTPDFSTQMFRSNGLIVGGAGHYFSYPEADRTTGEITAPVVEIIGGTTIQDFKYAYSQPGGGSPYTQSAGAAVVTTGPALLVALWGGDAFGLTHDVVANDGFTIIDSYLNLGPSSAVQAAVAVRQVAAAGSYSMTWTSTSDSGAACYLVAVQG